MEAPDEADEKQDTKQFKAWLEVHYGQRELYIHTPYFTYMNFWKLLTLFVAAERGFLQGSCIVC